MENGSVWLTGISVERSGAAMKFPHINCSSWAGPDDQVGKPKPMKPQGMLNNLYTCVSKTVKEKKIINFLAYRTSPYSPYKRKYID